MRSRPLRCDQRGLRDEEGDPSTEYDAMQNQDRTQWLDLRKVRPQEPRARKTGEDDDGDNDRHAGIKDSFPAFGVYD